MVRWRAPAPPIACILPDCRQAALSNGREKKLIQCACRASAEDLISAVQFDSTGDYLATGDRGGRVVIFESSEMTHRAAVVRAASTRGA